MKNQPFNRRLQFALDGIRNTWIGEASFRFQCLAAVTAVGLLAVLRAEAIWWAVFLMVIGTILAAELFNTALERLADRLHPDAHPTIAVAKDCAAGAVLILSVTSVLLMLVFLLHKLYQLRRR